MSHTLSLSQHMWMLTFNGNWDEIFQVNCTLVSSNSLNMIMITFTNYFYLAKRNTRRLVIKKTYPCLSRQMTTCHSANAEACDNLTPLIIIFNKQVISRRRCCYIQGHLHTYSIFCTHVANKIYTLWALRRQLRSPNECIKLQWAHV